MIPSMVSEETSTMTRKKSYNRHSRIDKMLDDHYNNAQGFEQKHKALQNILQWEKIKIGQDLEDPTPSFFAETEEEKPECPNNS